MINAFLSIIALFACAIQFGTSPNSNAENANIFSLANSGPKKAQQLSNSPFVRTNTFPDKVVVRDPIGYFIYDMSVYRTDFTDVSYLYLCELDVDFTPGSVATKNESGYDRHYDFWSADVSLGVSNAVSQAKVKDFWPKSSAVTVSITSEYSQTYTIGRGVEFSLSDGVKFAASESMGYTISHSVTTTTEDPSVSSQLLSSNPKTAKWNIQCVVQRSLTYNFSCFLLVELPKNYSNSFSFSTLMDMTCIAWKGYWWEQQKHVTANDSISAN